MPQFKVCGLLGGLWVNEQEMLTNLTHLFDFVIFHTDRNRPNCL